MSAVWPDWPKADGLFDVLRREAAVADRHAVLALEAETLGAMRTHLGHVLHALNPAAVPRLDGPGLGYGLIRAARDATAESYRAGATAVPGGSIDSGAADLATAFTTVSSRGRDAAILARQAAQAPTLETAKATAEQMQRMTGALIDGLDRNGDGEVAMRFGEAGLEQATAAFDQTLEAAGLTRADLKALEVDGLSEMATDEG
ncbi:MAG: hypothetical protein RIB45_14415 [Marivibrio sp.]|uniref:hypothetical protein n=1 Tax=Marivibrio sp. TaxID=2039719 RepID=UPI0032EC8B7E